MDIEYIDTLNSEQLWTGASLSVSAAAFSRVRTLTVGWLPERVPLQVHYSSETPALFTQISHFNLLSMQLCVGESAAQSTNAHVTSQSRWRRWCLHLDTEPGSDTQTGLNWKLTDSVQVLFPRWKKKKKCLKCKTSEFSSLCVFQGNLILNETSGKVFYLSMQSHCNKCVSYTVCVCY